MIYLAVGITFMIGVILWLLKWAVILVVIAFFLVLFTPEEYFERFRGRVDTLNYIVDEKLEDGKNGRNK